MRPVSAFGPKGGSWCRTCKAASERERRLANPEQFRERERQRRLAQPEAYKLRDRRTGARYRAKRRAAKVAAACLRKCAHCQTEFTSTAPRRKFCTPRCSARFQWRRKIATTSRRRARKFGVAYEYINYRDIFERDRWRCQICGCKTPQAWRGTKRTQAPEIDHRVPMALGGGHVWSNVQCACRSCNAQKGARTVVGQLSMLGKPRANTLTMASGISMPHRPQLTLVTCASCGAEFGTRISRQRFCSKICCKTFHIRQKTRLTADQRVSGTYVPRPRRSRAKNAVPRQYAVSKLIYLTVDGKRIRLKKAAEAAGLKAPTLSKRIFKLGWTVERALALQRYEGHRVPRGPTAATLRRMSTVKHLRDTERKTFDEIAVAIGLSRRRASQLYQSACVSHR
jgi:HNH endonuclease